jgi:hypothetical protein
VQTGLQQGGLIGMIEVVPQDTGVIMQWLRRLFSAGPAPVTVLTVTVRCDHCGQLITTRINLLNDLSELDQPDGNVVFVVRKTLVADRCFRRLNTELRFTRDRRFVSAAVSGGTMITPAR